MLALNIIAISLISIGFVKARPSDEHTARLHPKDLRSALDWIYLLHGAEEKIQEHMEFVKEQQKNLTKVENVDLAGGLFETVRSIGEFRSYLIKTECPSVLLIGPVNNNITLLIHYLPILRELFSALNEQVTECLESAGEALDNATIMSNPELMKWFENHGFEEGCLNDVVIVQLKEKLDALCRKHVALRQLGALFNGCTFYTHPNLLGEQLSWLYVFVSSPVTIEMAEKHFSKQGSKVQASDAIDIIRSLDDLSEKDNPLRRIFKDAEDGRLTTCMAKLYKDLVVLERPDSYYVDILTDIGKTMDLYLRRFIEQLSTEGANSQERVFETYGFKVNGTLCSEYDVVSDIKALGEDDSPITILGKALRNAYPEEASEANSEVTSVGTSEPASEPGSVVVSETSSEGNSDAASEAYSEAASEDTTETPVEMSVEVTSETPIEAKSETSTPNLRS